MSNEKKKGGVVIAPNLIKKSTFIDKDGNEITAEEARKQRAPLQEGTKQMPNGMIKKSSVIR